MGSLVCTFDPTYQELCERLRAASQDWAQKFIDDESGNCWAACLASLTGIPFEELRADVGDPADCDRDMQRLLHNRMMELLHERGWTVLHAGTRIPKGFSVAVGPSFRGDFLHCWIAWDGKPYFDPHPSRKFTASVTRFEVPVKIMGTIDAAMKGDHE